MSNEQDLQDYARQCLREMSDLANQHTERTQKILSEGNTKISRVEAHLLKGKSGLGKDINKIREEAKNEAYTWFKGVTWGD